MAEAVLGSCRQTSCNVAADGACVERKSPSECPFFVPASEGSNPRRSEEPDDDAKLDAKQRGDSAGFVELLLSAEELIGEDVDRVMRASLTRVIVVAGSPDSGKTTLLITPYDFLNEGSYAGYLFAGSETLAGFERRCFRARLASMRAKATTERTLAEETARFLHVAVRREDLSLPAQSLLLADVSGEVFEQVQSNADDLQMLDYVRRADHFVLLIDGGKLVDPRSRQVEANSALRLLRGLCERGTLGQHSYVDILFSRWDLVCDNSRAEETDQFVRVLQSDVESKFTKRVGRLHFRQVAARPENESLQPGYNVAPLFSSWVEDSPLLHRRWHDAPPLPKTLSEFLARTGQGESA